MKREQRERERERIFNDMNNENKHLPIQSIFAITNRVIVNFEFWFVFDFVLLMHYIMYG